MKATRIGVLIAVAALVVPQFALAALTFDQLDDDVFIVSHRVKVKFWMSRGKAARMVYEKAASLCVAAGYTHLEILQQESEAIQQDDTANASLRVRFFLEDGDDRIDCGRKASDRYVEQAAAKLQENGYRNSSVEATAEIGSSRPGVGR